MFFRFWIVFNWRFLSYNLTETLLYPSIHYLQPLGRLQPIAADIGQRQYTLDGMPDYHRSDPDRPPFTLTFTPMADLESPINLSMHACLWNVWRMLQNPLTRGGRRSLCLMEIWDWYTQTESLTIHFMHGYLSKDVHVWSVEHSAEYPNRAGIIRVEERLIGHSISQEPHGQKEKEEENILHLREAKRDHHVMNRILIFSIYRLFLVHYMLYHQPSWTTNGGRASKKEHAIAPVTQLNRLFG